MIKDMYVGHCSAVLPHRTPLARSGRWQIRRFIFPSAILRSGCRLPVVTPTQTPRGRQKRHTEARGGQANATKGNDLIAIGIVAAAKDTLRRRRHLDPNTIMLQFGTLDITWCDHETNRQQDRAHYHGH